MPELPEVETVRRIVGPQVEGLGILSVRVLNPKLIAHPDAAAFAEALRGRAFRTAGRRGKFLRFELEDGACLILHLRMTGQLLVTPGDWPEEKHTHLILGLSDGRQLRYIDARRFGRFWYLQKDEEDTFTGMDRLGPEPGDPALTADFLKEKLQKKHIPVKEALHDQRVVAGIGNIYSDEILFAAGIRPTVRCAELTDGEWRRLAEAIPAVIRWATEANRMTPEEYLAGKGREYRNTPGLKAYGRAGMPCVCCGTRMERITIAGRSGCFCPACQPDRAAAPSSSSA